MDHLSKKISNPQFLLKFLTEKHLDENLAKVFMPKAYDKIYCGYIALNNVEDLDSSWIKSAKYDKEDDTILLQMEKSKYAKDIKKSCNGMQVDYGRHTYTIRVKTSDDFVIIAFDETE